MGNFSGTMKTLKLKIGITALLLTLVTIYLFNEDSLPPRTPRKIARLISGLDISRRTELKKTIDIWAPNGDGEVLVKGKLTNSELNDLIREAKDENFKMLPIISDLGPAIIPDDLMAGKNGLYKLEIDKIDPRNYNLTIIDVDKNELITYISVL